MVRVEIVGAPGYKYFTAEVIGSPVALNGTQLYIVQDEEEEIYVFPAEYVHEI
jgi:hypothetical protein